MQMRVSIWQIFVVRFVLVRNTPTQRVKKRMTVCFGPMMFTYQIRIECRHRTYVLDVLDSD